MKKLLPSIMLVLFVLVMCQTKAQVIEKWKLADLKTAIKKSSQPTIYNFWATFCLPCIEEVPYFQQMVKKYDSSGVKLVFISLDPSENYPQKLNSFTSKFKFTYPVKFLDETDADKFVPVVDKNWSGAIPATLFINNKTGYRKFYEELLSKNQLEKEIKLMIGKKKK